VTKFESFHSTVNSIEPCVQLSTSTIHFGETLIHPLAPREKDMPTATRSSAFAEGQLPLRQTAAQYGVDLRHIVEKTSGPFSWLNPTNAAFGPRQKDLSKWAAGEQTGGAKEGVEDRPGASSSSASAVEREAHEDGEHEEPADSVEFKWTSRNNRKGRHQLEFTPASDPSTAKYLVPEPTSAPREVFKNIGRMFTDYPVWDISWVVAYIFVWGSIVWVINAL
jgi:hypothetical protein